MNNINQRPNGLAARIDRLEKSFSDFLEKMQKLEDEQRMALRNLEARVDEEKINKIIKEIKND